MIRTTPKKKTQLSNNKIIELFNTRIIGLEPTRLTRV
jgi:hypothetical protein